MSRHEAQTLQGYPTTCTEYLDHIHNVQQTLLLPSASLNLDINNRFTIVCNHDWNNPMYMVDISRALLDSRLGLPKILYTVY